MLVEYTFTRSDGSKLVMEYPFAPYNIDRPEEDLQQEDIFILEIFESEKAYECTVELTSYDASTDTTVLEWEHRYTLADFICEDCEVLDELVKHNRCQSCCDRLGIGD